MAAELSISGSIAFSKNGRVLPPWAKSMNVDVAGKDFDSGSQVVNPTATDAQGTLVTIKPSIGTLGYAIFHNPSADSTITWGIRVGGTYGACGKLKPGEFSGPVRLAMAYNALYASTGTDAAADLLFVVVED